MRRLFAEKKCLRIMEAVSALEAVIAERSGTSDNRFDGLWLSGLCHAAWKCVPDDGTMPIAEKVAVLRDIRRVSELPVMLDCDTGGSAEEFCIALEEFAGLASAVVIEDKCGVKRNSLYGTSVEQKMEDADVFSNKLRRASAIAKNADILVFARIESLIAGESVETAMIRAEKYLSSGADGIVIHSIRHDGSDVFAFAAEFRRKFPDELLLMIPTVYNSFTVDQLSERGANAVIYANQLTRSAFSAMKKTAEMILENGCTKQADEEFCVSPRVILETIEGKI